MAKLFLYEGHAFLRGALLAGTGPLWPGCLPKRSAHMGVEQPASQDQTSVGQMGNNQFSDLHLPARTAAWRTARRELHIS